MSVDGKDIAAAVKRGHDRILEKKSAAEELRRQERIRIAAQHRDRVDELVKRLEAGALLKLVEDTVAEGKPYALVSSLDAAFAELTGGQGATVNALHEAVNRIAGFHSEQVSSRQVRITWKADYSDFDDGEKTDG